MSNPKGDCARQTGHGPDAVRPAAVPSPTAVWGQVHAPRSVRDLSSQEPDEGGDSSRARAIQRWVAGAMIGLGGGRRHVRLAAVENGVSCCADLGALGNSLLRDRHAGGGRTPLWPCASPLDAHFDRVTCWAAVGQRLAVDAGAIKRVGAVDRMSAFSRRSCPMPILHWLARRLATHASTSHAPRRPGSACGSKAAEAAPTQGADKASSNRLSNSSGAWICGAWPRPSNSTSFAPGIVLATAGPSWS